MTAGNAAILFGAVVAARATAYLFSKLLLVQMGPFTLMGLRFLVAFALLAAIFHRNLRAMDRRTFAHGLLLGALFFIVMGFELVALTMAPSSTVSFLENTAIVFVPLLAALLARRLPAAKTVGCTAVVMAGVGLLTAGDGLGAFGLGEALALLAAVFYAVVIIVTARVARDDDATCLGVLQVGFIGLFGLVASVLFEQPALPAGPMEWAYLGVLVVVCTGFGFTFQPVAQRHISSEQAGLLLAVSPLVGGILGVVVLGEPFGPATCAGMALIIAGILLTNVGPGRAADCRGKSLRAGFAGMRRRGSRKTSAN